MDWRNLLIQKIFPNEKTIEEYNQLFDRLCKAKGHLLRIRDIILIKVNKKGKPRWGFPIAFDPLRNPAEVLFDILDDSDCRFLSKIDPSAGDISLEKSYNFITTLLGYYDKKQEQIKDKIKEIEKKKKLYKKQSVILILAIIIWESFKQLLKSVFK